MPIKTKGKYRYKIGIATEKVSLSEDSPTAAFHRLTHASPSGCFTTFQQGWVEDKHSDDPSGENEEPTTL